MPAKNWDACDHTLLTVRACEKPTQGANEFRTGWYVPSSVQGLTDIALSLLFVASKYRYKNKLLAANINIDGNVCMHPSMCICVWNKVNATLCMFNYFRVLLHDRKYSVIRRVTKINFHGCRDNGKCLLVIQKIRECSGEQNLTPSKHFFVSPDTTPHTSRRQNTSNLQALRSHALQAPPISQTTSADRF